MYKEKKMKETRVPTNYAFSREQKRYIAKQNVKNKQKEDTKQVLTERARAKKEEKWKVPAGKKYFKNDYYIMEIKTLGAMPLWLVRSLSKLNI